MTATTTQDTTSTPGTSTPSTPDATLTQAPDPAAACPGLRATRARRTRAAIQSAALRLASERGFDATTVEDVAAAAGVSRRTVFNYFPAKADMFIIGPRTPSQEEIETFVASRGDLLTDVATLMANAGPATANEVELYTRLKAVLHDSPELLPQLQSRIRLFQSTIRAAIARRLDAPLADPRVVAAAALTTALFKGAIDLWSGDAAREEVPSLTSDGDDADRPAPPAASPTVPPPEERADAARPPATVAACVDLITSSLREVLDLPAVEPHAPDLRTTHVRKENA